MSSPHSSDSEDDIPAIRDKEDQEEEEDGVEGTSRQGQGQGSGIDLTGFLFGNIDEEGRLSEDSASFLDRSTREKLGGLSRLLSASGGALGVPAAGAGEGDDEDDDYDLDKIVQEGSAGQDKEEGGEKAEEEAFDGTQKDPDAQDFSAIEDAMSDDSSSSDEDSQDGDAEKAKVSGEDDKEQQQKLAESAEEKPSTEVKKETEDSVAEVKEEPMEVEEREEAAKSTESTAEAQGKDAEDIKEEKPSDKQLMPPPSGLPVTATKSSPAKSPQPPPSPDAQSSPVKKDPAMERRPLAAMLPEKYKDTDVRELFPEFRPSSVLRFSRLFGIKASHRPRIWKNVRKKRQHREESSSSSEVNGNDSSDKKEFEWKFNYAELPEDPSAYEENALDRLMRPKEEAKDGKRGEEQEEERRGPRSTDWRFGPAQYWYDMLGLPEQVENYDYGLKAATDGLAEGEGDVKRENGGPAVKTERTSSDSSGASAKVEFPPDAFLMVTQVNWEDDVVWNGDDIRHKVMHKLSSKTNAAGWVPTGFNRTAGPVGKSDGAQQPGGGNPVVVGPMPGKGGGVHAIRPLTTQLKRPENGDDTFYSIFPVENEELAYGRWEDEVIWDAEDMPKKLKPKMVSLDPNDDNIILGIPDDIDPSTLPSDQPVKKVKIIQKHVKKSRMLLNRSGIISVVEEESPPPPPKLDNKDPFNISNDEFYMAKAQENLIKVATGGTLLQHATPVVELRAPFVPTHIGPIKLRQFHRWPLKRFSHGPLANYNSFHPVHPLLKNIRKKAKAREQEREAAGGGEMFFMRTPEDVSAKDGELVLFEYCEENPPLLSLVGMASKMKNYYKRKPGSDTSKGAQHRYGELTLAHTSPFLGQMAPGQTIQTIENNLFRAPVYEHTMPATDFVVIRTRNDYSIREADGIFVSGQECPLYEVPGPNSKRSNNFARDFLQVFIYRLFWWSRDNPKRIKMDEIKKAFPAHSESSIRKRLKPCAEFHRTGQDSNWWVIKPSFRLPTEEEMRSMVTPEQCCAFFSMIAAEQRLRDAGYGEKFLLAQQEEDDEESAAKLDDEVKTAPWNTTRAYILAMKGKCLLQLTGPADPTGPAGEGFSYVRIPNKPVNKEEQEQQPKRTVTGTDADLRKLPLKDARAILRKNGVPEDAIMKLSRWEVIDVVRTLSTEKVKAGEDGDHKFSRGNRFSIAEHQERYREDCQRIFEVQNKVLASEEILSSDEGESSEEEDANDDDLYEMGKNLENMLSNKKSSSQFKREQEEAERRKLQKMIMGDDGDGDDSQGNKRKRGEDGDEEEGSNTANKVLRITRTFKNEAGNLYTRTELVRKPLVVETYVKVRENKDEAFIRQFATLDDSAKEEMKKEKRRIQEQLRRIKRNQEREKQTLQQQQQKQLQLLHEQQMQEQMQQQLLKSGKKGGRLSKMKNSDLKLRCGACGAKGHMRTNKACPKFVGSELEMMGPVNVAMTEKDEEEMEKEELLELEDDEELVNVDGTKISLSSKLLRHTDEMRKRTVQLKVPKKVLKAARQAAAGGSGASSSLSAFGKKRRAGAAEHCDYLTKSTYRPAKRRRTDPVISLASFLESLHGELRLMDDALQFLQPVNTKKVPDYLDKIKTPMDLQTIRENIQNKKYHTRLDFLQDISLIVENSATYNGGDDIYTKSAEKLRDIVVQRFEEEEDKLIKLENEINPLLDDDRQKGFTHVIRTVLEDRIKAMPESWPFHKPVSRKNVKNYYEVIKQPMDLEMVEKKVNKHEYHTRDEFVGDIELIYRNSVTFNGENSEYSLKALRILEATRVMLAPFEEELSKYEEGIKEAQKRIVEQAEVDSLGASLGEDSNLAGTPLAPPGKRKRGRPRKIPLSSEFVPNSDDEAGSSPTKRGRRKTKKSAEAAAAEALEAALESGDVLADDLRYSSDEDDDDDDPDDADWEAVEDDQDQVEEEEDGGEGLTVTIENMEEQQQAMVIEEGQIVDIDDMGYLGDLPADSSASALLFGGPGTQQSQQPQEEGGEQQQQSVAGAEEAELQQVDESYDPTAFFSSIGKGDQSHEEGGGGGEETPVIQEAPSGMEVAATVEMPDIVHQISVNEEEEGAEVVGEAQVVEVNAEAAAAEAAPAEEQVQEQIPSEQPQPTEAVEAAAPPAVDIINDDLDISDDSDEDEDGDGGNPPPPPPGPASAPAPPPPAPEDDDDGMTF